MRKISTFLAAAWLACASLTTAQAGTTINTGVPAQGSPITSAPIRQNFQAAASDINNILGCFAGVSAPASPSTFQTWCNTSGGSIIIVNQFDGTTWVPIATLNTTTHTYSGNTSSPVIYATNAPYNAACDGVTNDATAINNALAAAPPGATVKLPSGKACKINSSLTMGNGSSSAASTINGVVLDCDANPVSTSYFGGMSATAGCKLLWGGGAAPMLQVLGPIQGWGVRHVYFDCASVAGSIGLKTISAQGGEVTSNAFVNCAIQGSLAQTVPQGGIFGDSNNENNVYLNNLFVVPNIANAIGAQETGQATDATSDSHANTWINTKFLMPATSTAMTAISMQDVDADVWMNTTIFGGGSGCVAVNFNYTDHNTWPASNVFSGLDPGSGCAVSFSNSGTPGTTARPNYIYGLIEANGASNPLLSNLNPALPTIVAPGISLTAQTASIGSTNVNPSPIYKTGMYRFNYDLMVTTAGTGGTVTFQISWTDEAGAHTNVNLGGTINLNALSSNSAGFPFRITSGNNISFSTTVAGATGSPQYALFIRLEKMD